MKTISTFLKILWLKLKIHSNYRALANLEEDIMFHCIDFDTYVEEKDQHYHNIETYKSEIKALRLSKITV